jgi:phage gp45-like
MIRGIFQSLTETAGKVRRFIASGRVREIVRNGGFYQHYGLASDPPASAKLIIDGHSGTEVSIAEDDPATRPQLKSMNGSVCIYSDADHYVLIKKDGSIEIKTDQPVTVLSDDIRLGSESLLSLKNLIDSRLIEIYNAHTHLDPVSGSTLGPSVLLSEATVATSKVRGA